MGLRLVVKTLSNESGEGKSQLLAHIQNVLRDGDKRYKYQYLDHSFTEHGLAETVTYEVTLKDAKPPAYLIYDWAYTSRETGERKFAQSPEKAAALAAEGYKLTPLYTSDAD